MHVPGCAKFLHLQETLILDCSMNEHQNMRLLPSYRNERQRHQQDRRHACTHLTMNMVLLIRIYVRSTEQKDIMH